MKLKNYINQIIPALRLKDSLNSALILMEENKVAELPVINAEEELIGLITESFLLENVDLSQTVEESNLPAYLPKGLSGDKHVFEAFSYLSSNQLTIVPIIDASRKYMGCVSVHDLIPVFDKISSFDETGGIIVLGAKAASYSLSDIARIVETNNAKVLSTFILSNDSNPDNIKVVVKINQSHVNNIVASFERYDYQILEKYSSEEEVDPQHDNLGNFFNYLDL